MKKIIKAYVILWCASLASGCSFDESIPAVPPGGEESRIALFIPGAEEVRVYSTATAAENQIEDCFVLVFKDGYKNSEKVAVADIMANGEAAALLPQLSFKLETGDTVYVICNTGLTALPANIASITANNINATFPPAKPYYFSGEALPMSGYTVWSPTASSVVTLTRAVAKVQVRLGETFSIAEFEAMPSPGRLYGTNMLDPDMSLITENINLCEFAVVNHAGKSDILQPSSGFSQTLSDSTGFYGTFEKPLRLMQYASADEMAVYVSEYPNSTMDCKGTPINSDSEFNYRRQHLLLMERNIDFIPGVIYVAGIWRLDFYDAANKKYLDIKRNHTYTFTINRIRSLPYFAGGPFQILKEESAGVTELLLPASNIEYSIAVEDDWANKIYSNGQYALAVSADTINDGNVHLPFKVKVYIPADIDANQIGQSGVMFVRDRNGHLIINSSSYSFRVYNANGQNYGEFPLLMDGTTNVFTFTWNPSGLDAENFDNGSLYIYLGNIWKRIPIMLTATP